MKVKTGKKKSFIKKIFIQICRRLGYEIIDQANYEVATSEKKLHESQSIQGEKSITIPTGTIKINRKIKNLHIIFRCCFLDSMLTQRKKRLFDYPKKEYALRSLNSICKSIIYYQNNNPDFKIKLTVSDTRSEQKDLNSVKSLLKKFKINSEVSVTDLDKFKDKIKGIKSLAMFSYMANVYNSFLMAKDQDYDLIYFVDDDYIHRIEAIQEMVLSYEKLATITKQEMFLCPCDYPYLYFKPEPTYILLGDRYHWRRVTESLCTFVTSKSMILKNWNQLIKLANKVNDPFEKPLDKLYDNELCFSPIKTLSIHCANINSIFGLSPNTNWQKLWLDNKIKK